MVAVVVGAVLTAGCVGDADSDGRGVGPLAVVDADLEMLARATGVVEITERCVFLKTQEGRRLLVWPAERTVWDRGGRIRFEPVGGEVVEVADGDWVAVGGGPGTDLAGEVGWVNEPDPGCEAEGEWVVGAHLEVVPAAGWFDGDEHRNVGWYRLADPPLSPRVGATVASVDGHLVIVGGTEFLCPPTARCFPLPDPPLTNGAVLSAEVTTTDPFGLVTSDWEPIADAPAPFVHARHVVEGKHLYVVNTCAFVQPCDPQMLRYTPETNEWTTLSGPPGPALYLLVATELGLIAYLGSDQVGDFPDLVYDPLADTWNPIPTDPLPPVYSRTLVGHDQKLLLFGTPIDRDLHPSKRAALYDPTTATWTELAAAESTGFEVWTDGHRHYLNPHFGPGGGIYTPDTNTWTSLPPHPDPDHADMNGIISGDHTTYTTPHGWSFHTNTNKWIQIPARPDSADISAESIGTAGANLVVFGGQRWPTHDQGELLNDTWIWAPGD